MRNQNSKQWRRQPPPREFLARKTNVEVGGCGVCGLPIWPQPPPAPGLSSQDNPHRSGQLTSQKGNHTGSGTCHTNTFHTNPWPLFLPSDVTGLCIWSHLSKLDPLSFPRVVIFHYFLQRPGSTGLPRSLVQCYFELDQLGRNEPPTRILGKRLPKETGRALLLCTNLNEGPTGQEAAHTVYGGCGDKQLCTDPRGFVHQLWCYFCLRDETHTPPPQAGITC